MKNNGRLSNSELQRALDSLAAANRKAQIANEKIANHCLAVYGVEPGDIDNDEFIDTVGGGCGSTSNMTVADFDKSMRKALEMRAVFDPDIREEWTGGE